MLYARTRARPGRDRRIFFVPLTENIEAQCGVSAYGAGERERVGMGTRKHGSRTLKRRLVARRESALYGEKPFKITGARWNRVRVSAVKAARTSAVGAVFARAARV